MAILSNSWAEHLKNLGGNEDANKHMKAFTNALTPSKTIPEQVNALVEEVDAGILLVGPQNSILQTHSWISFGGTWSRPDYNIFCLIETGPLGQGVSVDIISVTSAYPISIFQPQRYPTAGPSSTLKAWGSTSRTRAQQRTPG
jgi:hypothetical protein